VRVLTRTILEQHGYQVLEATHAVDALRIWDLHAGPIHLLLTDIVMPEGVSGQELAAWLQERNPQLRVIFTSGYSGDIAGRDFVLQEGQNFLQKPCPTDRILETVRKCLDT
jgi:DNA-binding NtrC family response regulator